MKKKATKKKKKTTSKGKSYTFKFSRKELFLWLGLTFISLAWMFVLGIMVGRGLFPAHLNETLKEQLIALKDETNGTDSAVKGPDDEVSPDDMHLGFYDVLTDKKEEARLKTGPRGVDRERQPDQKESVSERFSKPPLKKADINKDRLHREPVFPRDREKALFTLQVASLRDQRKAENMVSTLKKKGYGAYAVSTNVSGKGVYHRVRVGHFSEREEAVEIASRLKGDHFSPIMMQE